MDTPCVQVCVVQDGYCLGCNRSQQEIADWTSLTDEQRLRIIEELDTRETPGWD